jgi:hypothetical protein
MHRSTDDQVWERATSRCEYCQMPQSLTDAGREIDNVIAEKHCGLTALENLALACFHGNNHNGPNRAGVDPDSGG